MTKDLLDLDATPERLQVLVDAGVLPPEALHQALALAVASPPRPWWGRFMSTALLGVGTPLVLSGVISFFAFNWAGLHRFGKFGVMMAAIAAAALTAWRLGESLAGQFALLFAAVLPGPLLAVYGQVYHTGSDPYELFLLWGVLILPWVILARFAPLWLVELLLANIALRLAWDLRLNGWSELFSTSTGASLTLVLAVLNGGAWLAAELLGHRQVPWLQGRWVPRVLAVLTLGPLMRTTAWAAVELKLKEGPLQGACMALLAAVLVACYGFHRRVRSELFLLTLGAMCVMTLVTTLVGHGVFDILKHNQAVALLFMALVLVGELTLAVKWLRHEAFTRGAEDT